MCKDDVPAKPRPPREDPLAPSRVVASRVNPSAPGRSRTWRLPPSLPHRRTCPGQFRRGVAAGHAERIAATPSRLEKQFVDLTGPLDAPERQDLSRKLALVYSAVRRCTGSLRLLGQRDLGSSDAAGGIGGRLAQLRAPRRPRPSRGRSGPVLAGGRLSSGRPSPTGSGPGLGGRCAKPPAEFVSHLDRIQAYLEKNDPHLSVRGCWLAWFALARGAATTSWPWPVRTTACSNDCTATACTPARPAAFLRLSGRAGTRFQAIRDRVARLRDLARKWAHQRLGIPDPGLRRPLLRVRPGPPWRRQRVPEDPECRQGGGIDGDEVHSFLLQGYTFRIQQVLEGKGHGGPLPPEMLEYLEHQFKPVKGTDDAKNQGKLKRYKIDKLRQYSRILDPHEMLDAYRLWHGHSLDELTQSLAALRTSRTATATGPARQAAEGQHDEIGPDACAAGADCPGSGAAPGRNVLPGAAGPRRAHVRPASPRCSRSRPMPWLARRCSRRPPSSSNAPCSFPPTTTREISYSSSSSASSSSSRRRN